MSYATVRRRGSNGDMNKLCLEDRAAHSWYRFVLSFPPHLVQHYLEHLEVEPGQVVLDPFCGTGTTLVECKKMGVASIGVEANPMAFFASQVKTDWAVDPHSLHVDASRAASRASRALAALHLRDEPSEFNERVPVDALRRLPGEREKLLLKGSISPLPLHKTLLLLDKIGAGDQPLYAHHERLAVAKILTTTVGNLHFGPEVGVGPPKPDAAVLASWMEEIDTMANDLASLPGPSSPAALALFGDARAVDQLVEPNCIDAVITSPPYPNEKDYSRVTRLESVILGFIRDKDELRSLKRQFVRSNTRSVYQGDDDSAWVQEFPAIRALAEEIEARRIALGKTSGFERLYATVTKLYFGGMARHLASLRPCLRRGARLAYVLGDQASYLRVMIRTGTLFAEIAESLGYEVVGIDLFRTRLATATREQLREEVVLLRWPGAA